MSPADALPKVSLVIPSYKRGPRILPTLRSALAQTHPLSEIIVVNDGGSADTRAAVAELGSPAVTIVDRAQGGAPAARNHGANIAAGPVLMLLDDDDILHPYATEVLLKTLTAFPEARASFCDHTFKDMVTGEYRSDHFHQLPHYQRFRQLRPVAEIVGADRMMLFGRNLHVALLEGNLLGQPWMIWRDTYLAIGGFESGLGSADDWDLYLRLTRNHRVAVVDRVASDHFRESGRVHLTTEDGQPQKQAAVARRQLALAGTRDLAAQTILRRKLGGHYKSFGDVARDQNTGEARRHYLTSLCWWPFDPVVALRVLFPTL
jgi:glycosyltransferase involved in cell wall biosynthesis